MALLHKRRISTPELLICNITRKTRAIKSGKNHFVYENKCTLIESIYHSAIDQLRGSGLNSGNVPWIPSLQKQWTEVKTGLTSKKTMVWSHFLGYKQLSPVFWHMLCVCLLHLKSLTTYGCMCRCHLKNPSRVKDACFDSPQESFPSYGCMCGCHFQNPSRVRHACFDVTYRILPE
jgi:hypothetical protein